MKNVSKKGPACTLNSKRLVLKSLTPAFNNGLFPLMVYLL